MFVCDQCHNPRCGAAEFEVGSRGLCESCGKARTTKDCQGYKLIPFPPEQERKLIEMGIDPYPHGVRYDW